MNDDTIVEFKDKEENENKVMKGAVKLHDFRNTLDGVDRWAEVYKVQEGFNVTFFKSKIMFGMELETFGTTANSTQKIVQKIL